MQELEKLLSEKEAALRLSVARITLLRARQAGRVRFYRIGIAVRYSPDQLNEFLTNCECKGRKSHELESYDGE